MTSTTLTDAQTWIQLDAQADMSDQQLAAVFDAKVATIQALRCNFK